MDDKKHCKEADNCAICQVVASANNTFCNSCKGAFLLVKNMSWRAESESENSNKVPTLLLRD